MTPESNDDHLLGIQSALILLFDGLEDYEIMDLLDSVLPKELSIWHVSDIRGLETVAINMENTAKVILDTTSDGTGIGTLAVQNVAMHSKVLLNYLARIRAIIDSVGKQRRAQ